MTLFSGPASAAKILSIAAPLPGRTNLYRTTGFGGQLLIKEVASLQEAVAMGGVLLITSSGDFQLALIGAALRSWVEGGIDSPLFHLHAGFELDDRSAGFVTAGDSRPAQPALDEINLWRMRAGTAPYVIAGIVSGAETGFGFNRLANNPFIYQKIGSALKSRAAGAVTVPSTLNGIALPGETYEGYWCANDAFEWPAAFNLGLLFCVTRLPYFESFKTTLARVRPSLLTGDPEGRPYIERAWAQIFPTVQDYVPTFRSVFCWTSAGIYHGPGGVTETVDWGTLIAQPNPTHPIGLVYNRDLGGGTYGIAVHLPGVAVSTASVITQQGFKPSSRSTGKRRKPMHFAAARGSEIALPNLVEVVNGVPGLYQADRVITDPTTKANYLDALLPQIPNSKVPGTVAARLLPITGAVGHVGTADMRRQHLHALPGTYLMDSGQPIAEVVSLPWSAFAFPEMPPTESYSVELEMPAVPVGGDVALVEAQLLAAAQMMAESEGSTKQYPASVAWATWGPDIYDQVRTQVDRVMSRAIKLAE